MKISTSIKSNSLSWVEQAMQGLSANTISKFLWGTGWQCINVTYETGQHFGVAFKRPPSEINSTYIAMSGLSEIDGFNSIQDAITKIAYYHKIHFVDACLRIRGLTYPGQIYEARHWVEDEGIYTVGRFQQVGHLLEAIAGVDCESFLSERLNVDWSSGVPSDGDTEEIYIVALGLDKLTRDLDDSGSKILELTAEYTCEGEDIKRNLNLSFCD